ncbi:MAG TPA: transglutaminase-like domain-containing protein, partial [Chthoniobacteraceae bacterium]|nr:transglutaminase-like domain-containing protein [Chthoniobacteraceae bacterium]
LCGSFPEQGDVEDAAWRLAATFSPGEDFGPQRTLLDAWGAEVRKRLRKATTDCDRIETLVEFLGDEVRLRGNEDDYYNLNNSLLPEVIDTRVGIPITLSLIYILVGRRAGMELSGVGLPGHFIVRHGDSFFDPFHGGRRVGLEECRTLLEQQNLVLAAHHLQPVGSRQILLRMLSNIYALSEESDPPLAAKVSSWIAGLRRAG